MTSRTSFDLDLLAPQGFEVELTLEGKRRKLQVPGDLPVPTLVRLMQIEDEPDATDALTHAYDLIVEVLRAANPELEPDPPLSALHVQQLIGILIAGSPELLGAQVAAAAVLTDTAATVTVEDGESLADAAGSDGEADGSVPLPASRSRSARRSPEPSSSSAR